MNKNKLQCTIKITVDYLCSSWLAHHGWNTVIDLVEVCDTNCTYGRTPLHYAASTHLEVVRYFIMNNTVTQ